jgi:hypothetical protein
MYIIIYGDIFSTNSTMSKDSFDWDPEKDLANQAKHGISFSDAVC